MKTEYTIGQTSKTLFFTDLPKTIEKETVSSRDRKSFTSVVIPNSVSAIEQGVFYMCRALISIHIPNSVKNISKSAFCSCSYATFIHIPNSVSTIGMWAFEGCSSLASIHIPKAITTVDEWVFHNCRSLASIHIHNSINDIDAKKFYCCGSLHKICLSSFTKSNIRGAFGTSFQSQTAILRPWLEPICSLQKKCNCHAPKIPHSIYL